MVVVVKKKRDITVEKEAIDVNSTSRMKRFMGAGKEEPFPNAQEAGELSLEVPEEVPGTEEEEEFDMGGLLPQGDGLNLSGFGEMIADKLLAMFTAQNETITRAIGEVTSEIKTLKELITKLQGGHPTITKATEAAEKTTELPEAKNPLAGKIIRFLEARKKFLAKNKVEDNGTTNDEIIKGIKEENIPGNTIESKRAVVSNTLANTPGLTKIGRGKYTI
jgi:hypothetical protein